LAPRKLNLKPSAHVHGGTYDPKTKTLVLELNGGTFAHGGVEPEKAQALEDAESHGKFFNQHIAKQHAYSAVSN
jgi:hypothetical protein